MSTPRFSWLVLALTPAACVGAVGDAQDHPGDPAAPTQPGAPRSPTAGAPSTPAPPPTTPVQPTTPSAPSTPSTSPGTPAADGAGRWPLQRLTRAEIDNTLRDLLGDTSRAAEAFPADTRGTHGFLQPTPPSELLVQRLLESSADLAAAAVARTRTAPATGALFVCNPATTGEDACVAQFIASFGRRAFRRPLSTDETAAFTALDRKFVTELKYAYADRLRVLARGFLQSPEFLYHGPMRGQAGRKDGTSVALGGHELAARLSYFLWKTMPDDTLFAAAAGGKLTDPREVEAQARRMLADKRALDTIDQFHAEWLMVEHLDTLSKDPKAFPAFNEKLRASIAAERSAFLAGWMQTPTLDALLSATHAYVDPGLAKLYGVAAPTATGLQKTTLPAGQRAGILTQIAFLAEHADSALTKPVARGKVVYEQLLCGTVPPPPLEVPEPKPPAPGLTTRERFEEHAKAECARACHALMDPFGFAFEIYDALGVHRTTEGGKPIDATGAVTLPSDGPRSFTNAVELVGILANSADVRRCVTTKWARFALGRPDGAEEAASLERAFQAFDRSGRDVRELLVALATSKTFLHRALAPGEVLP